MQTNFNTLQEQLNERIGFLERTLEASNRSTKTAQEALQAVTKQNFLVVRILCVSTLGEWSGYKL